MYYCAILYYVILSSHGSISSYCILRIGMTLEWRASGPFPYENILKLHSNSIENWSEELLVDFQMETLRNAFQNQSEIALDSSGLISIWKP